VEVCAFVCVMCCMVMPFFVPLEFWMCLVVLVPLAFLMCLVAPTPLPLEFFMRLFALVPFDNPIRYFISFPFLSRNF